MARPNVDIVMSAIDRLLAGAMDEELMPNAAETMRQLFDGSTACFASFGPAPEDRIAYPANPDPSWQPFCEELAPELIEMGEILRGIPLGVIYRDHDAVGSEAPRSWQGWARPPVARDGLSCRLAEKEQAFWFFDVRRDEGQERFDDGDATLLHKLYPVLRRVAELRRHIGRVTIQRDEARGALDQLALGIVILDAEMRIAYANEGADDILAEPDGALGLRQGRLAARGPAEQRRLRQLVEGALHCAGDPLAHHQASMILYGSDGRHSLSACVMPAPPRSHGHVMIALRRLETATDIAACARQLFDLTDTEARFASALASGASLAEAAEAQRVRISTARTHLARIFQKTQTHQQSQLVSLLRSAVLPLQRR
ncbi:Helix-turn-helix transcriptional regulator [Hyphomicrobiales bacterium]|nr:Helix-turn-helix transcriptional regulator [Hyphomicrobiales bacterium]CAH1697164.1 Helix-turn-helix transcriptional regulator [Hyphomicrobiales bacterium]CAI0342732.1 Helix-turn-helix transcriptional regulator [Hyphomicrobiales bacterium]